MFRTFARLFLPNKLDWLCERLAKRKQTRILLAWNRGLGDIALGLYAIVHRIRELIPEAEITFLIRENLSDGFTLLEGVSTLIAPNWKRGEPYDVSETLLLLGRDVSEFDLIIPWPSPTDWVRWQHGRLVPRLKWNPSHDDLAKKFDLPRKFIYIGVQAASETRYGLWRNWPLTRWREFFERLAHYPHVRVLLFGFEREPHFEGSHLVDLRGHTTLFELLSLLKNRCHALIAPDSGILAMTYYLDTPFALQIISLWADTNHGILKQNVASPNPLLIHRPLVGAHRDLSTLGVDCVLATLTGLTYEKTTQNET